ncbi:MAG TPA: hypothetical protein VK674_05525 [Candidatus Limnocylindria bacterium]|nr:hypothetical protein [Candidatus Limnocylindria bacterium]
MSNIEAFRNLGEAVSETGQAYTREDVFSLPSHPKHQVIGQGLGREAQVDTEFSGTPVYGKLTVQAIVAADGVVAPFPVPHLSGEVPPKWLVTTRLDFEALENVVGIQPDEHRVKAVYVLAENDPEELDIAAREAADYEREVEEYTAALRQAHEYAGTTAVDSERLRQMGVPRYPGRPPVGPIILFSEFTHDLPDESDAQVVNSHPDNPRAGLLRQWFEEPPHADGMAMLSSTINGSVHADELPRTIGWLLRQA